MATVQLPKDFQIFIQELQSITTSEIKTDDLSLGFYATDASLYKLQPLAIAIPSNESDLIKIIQIANKYNIPVMPRGSATSLAGQNHESSADH
ncbi:MAG: FAD-binding oxidoreductase [Saprospiraceae bacterium]|nr:FAD-binding oxidoreductase [Saprospiraceae bacterium]